MTDERTVVRIDDLVIDEETGEVLEWPSGIVDRIRYLQEQQLLGKALEDDGKTIRQMAGRALGRELDALGERSIVTDSGRTRAVPPTDVRSAPASAVVVARGLELITDDEADELLIAAAKDLNRDAVEQWVSEHRESDDDRTKLLLILIALTPRAGWVQTERPRVKAPRVGRGAAS